MNEEREHLLISHIVDGRATDQEWRELEQLADRDPSVWRQLSQSQRDHMSLCSAIAGASAIAETVSLPTIRLRTSQDDWSSGQVRLNRFGAWTGWAVAAIVTIVASLNWMQPVPQPTGAETQLAGLQMQSAAQAFQAYLDKGKASGQVVGEVPARVLVETKPTVSGNGYEVIYLRQVVERAVVADLYQLSGQDDAGRPTLVRWQQPIRSSM